MRLFSISVAVALGLTASPASADVLASLAIEQPAQPIVPLVAPMDAADSPDKTSQPYETVTILIGGDLGMNASGQPVAADAVWRHGQRYTFADLTRGLVGQLKADVVFANFESVVSARNDLQPHDKMFTFRSHPEAVRHLVGLGFNVLSAANNHMIDYGEAGMAETVRHLAAMGDAGLKGAPGLGFGRAAATAPVTVELRQARVRIAAAGIGGASYGGDRPAMAGFHGPDLAEAAKRLQDDAWADIRMLSVHFGQELQVRPAAADEKRLRDLVKRHDIDVVAGHHAHVAAGVQMIDGRAIFYGLGNLLHPGMRDMNGIGTCRDFGVLAQVHFGRKSGETYKIRAIEVRTLADMHAAARVRRGDDAKARLAVLNHHATGLDDATGGARGVRFTPEAAGSGLYCTAHASDQDDDLAHRCHTVRAAPVLPTAGVSCGSVDVARAAPQASVAFATRSRLTERAKLTRAGDRFVFPSDR